MGLMQIMPQTWSGLRLRYGLGANPYDPHDNILAGAAYLRELHDRYGAPGFLAAYNAGPARYDDHLATGRPLPAETRAYVSCPRAIDRWRLDRRRDGCRGCCPFLDRSPAVRRACRKRPSEISGVNRCAWRPAVDRQNGRRLDRARSAIQRPVRHDVPSESATMSEIGLRRSLAGLWRRFECRTGGAGEHDQRTAR